MARLLAFSVAALAVAVLGSTTTQAQYGYYVAPYAPTYPTMTPYSPGYAPGMMPSAAGYVSYTIPGNYYQPTYQSYAPYAVPGAYQGGGYPVYSVDYAIPSNGNPTTTVVQSAGTNNPAPGLSTYYQAGYPGYAATSAYSNQSTLPRPVSTYQATNGPQNMTSPYYNPSGGAPYVPPSVPQPMTGLPAPAGGGMGGYGLPAPLPPAP